jgi:hypothetical protein
MQQVWYIFKARLMHVRDYLFVDIVLLWTSSLESVLYFYCSLVIWRRGSKYYDGFQMKTVFYHEINLLFRFPCLRLNWWTCEKNAESLMCLQLLRITFPRGVACLLFYMLAFFTCKLYTPSYGIHDVYIYL